MVKEAELMPQKKGVSSKLLRSFVSKSLIDSDRNSECIEKIYLPLDTNQNSLKIQIIACATPSTAVDYIEQFVLDKKSGIDERKIKLSNREAKDAFLLILTPAKKVNFYGKAKEIIHQIVSEYQTEFRAFTEDYYNVLNYYALASNTRNNFTFRKVLFSENIAEEQIHALIVEAIQNNKNFYDLDSEIIKNILVKCGSVKNIIDSNNSIDKMIERLSELVLIKSKENFKNDIGRQRINSAGITKLELEEEEEAELEEVEVKKMGAVELMTIVGSKGLSADHVMIIGFDNVNMSWVTKNAFYVAMTRARKSLHILTALKSGGAKQAHNFLEQLPDDHAEFYSYKKNDRTKNKLHGKWGFKSYLDNINSVSRRR